ncbi:MAG: lysine--tRNA ligase [Candidatus Eisenbacteria bacterium]|nr:lysine--tRNA ligase [Candidatus Latescibacterota bacterium]MBD3301009.1 lysine--tRNA ligase [Candidatus Eisenbacteria bacterium]
MDRREELRRVRIEKLEGLREQGVDPYPHVFHRTHGAGEILDRFEELEEKGTVSVAGRLMSLREMGKTAFAHIQDATGRIQIYLRRDDLPDGAFGLVKLLDLGDLIGVEGTVFRTRTGEISVRAGSLRVLCKSLLPLPVVKEKDGQRFDSVTDKEHRYRARHLDLMLNPESRRSLERRTEIIRALRTFLDERGFLEVETPILQTIYGGAMARPFTTRHNALSIDLYLRIALELHLKRLLVGGIERVYEIGRVFRNEGMDRLHNPEFTMLEFYWAYADYHDAMDLVEEMIRTVAERATGSMKIRWNEMEIDLSRPFRRERMADLIRDAAGLDLDTASDEDLTAWLREHDETLPPVPGRGPLIESVFDAAVVPMLLQPTFVLDHPRAISPLAKAHRERPDDTVERFELFIAGGEFANAFSELNDPLDQRARLEDQARRRAMGDEEAQQLDHEFLEAIEQGMPPAAGVGIGVDRLVMLLTGEANIRDVLFFPLMRPEEKPAEGEEAET